MTNPAERNGGETHRGLVGALQKGMQILDLYSVREPELSIGRMAQELDIHKSSASRLAATLAHSGYLQQSSAPGTYRLGQRLAALGTIAGTHGGVTEAVGPHLAELVHVTGETGHLAALRGADASTLAIVDGWHTVRMHSYVGKTSPAYVSSMGKALLAGLDDEQVDALLGDRDLPAFTPHTIASVRDLKQQLAELRSQGYGLDDEELEIGLRCISAPVFAADGTVDASISISGPTQRVTIERVPELAEHVRWHAWRASVARGATRAPAGWASAPTAPPPPFET